MPQRIVFVSLLALLLLPGFAGATEKAPAKTFTLKSKDVDIRDVLQMMGRQAGFSLILDKSIRGKVGVEMVDLPYKVALQAFAAAHKLVVIPWHKGHKLYIIAPLEGAKQVMKARAIMERLDKKGFPKPHLRAIEKRLSALEEQSKHRRKGRKNRRRGRKQREKMRKMRIIKMKKLGLRRPGFRREAGDFDGPPPPRMGWHDDEGHHFEFRRGGPLPREGEEVIEEEYEVR